MDMKFEQVDIRSLGNDTKSKYNAIYQRLAFETAVIIFKKSNGDNRVMLATRNPRTVTLAGNGDNKAVLKLNSHDRGCNIGNGNVSVMDLEIAECRAFNVDRVIDLYFVGQIMTTDELDAELKRYKEYKERLGDFYGGAI
jgi:hypothetical protein